MADSHTDVSAGHYTLFHYRGGWLKQIAKWALPQELTSAETGPAAELLSTYFHTMLKDGVPYYSGAMFETFAGGGDAQKVANTFTAEDLVAVSLLSVDVPGTAALRILGTRATEINGLLEGIPNGRELRDAADDEIAPGSAAEDLWSALRKSGVGPVTTSKLLARKRPALLPVIDTVVKKVLGHPARANFWLTLRAQLNADGGRLNEHLLEVREAAQLGEGISLIRCFDVVVWMIGKRDGVVGGRVRS